MSKLSLLTKAMIPFMLIPALVAAFLTSKLLISMKRWIAYLSLESAGVMVIFLLVIINFSL